MGYRAILFALDGDWVTDFPSDTKKEVIDKLANKGSRWYFFPLEAVIVDTLPFSSRRLVDVAPELECFLGKSVKTIARNLRETLERR